MYNLTGKPCPYSHQRVRPRKMIKETVIDLGWLMWIRN